VKARRHGLLAVALLGPPLLGVVIYLAAVRPLAGRAVAARAAWEAEERQLATVADHAEALATGHLLDALDQVAWLRDRLRPGAAAAFMEEVERAAAAARVGSVEYRRPGSGVDPTAGVRIERVALRVVAPYRRIADLWRRLDGQPTAFCQEMRLHRYGDRVAATFMVELPVDGGEGP